MNITQTNKLPHRDSLDFIELGRRLRAYGVLLKAVEHLDGSKLAGDLSIDEPLLYFMAAFERSLCVSGLSLSLLCSFTVFCFRALARPPGNAYNTS